MEKKFTIEELEAQYKETEEKQRVLKVLIEQRYKDEERLKQAKLAAEKDARYKEVIDAYKNFEELRDKYVDDYGQFTFETEAGLFSIRNFLFRG
jgi:hypothetical protein